MRGFRDSKTVTALERERLYDKITRAAVAWSVAAADREEIDRINIHQASLRAMQRAVLGLVPCPDFVIVDAFRIPDLLMAQRAVEQGDTRCTAIAAASIVAKVDPRSDDAGASRAAIPATGSTDTRATRRGITSTRSRGSATPMSTVGRSARHRCLIGWRDPLPNMSRRSSQSPLRGESSWPSTVTLR